MSDQRARRPIPNRTHPNRGILGVFGQSSWTSPSDMGHPLGPGFAEEVGAGSEPLEFLDDQVQEASDLVDRHIAQGALEREAEDDGLLGNLAGLYAGANGGDLTKIVATLTRTYADLAGKWVDLAGSVASQLGEMRGQNTGTSGGTGLGAAGPVLSIRASLPVEARVEMFRAALSFTVQPLGSDDPSVAARITDVKVEDGRLKVSVPADQPPGTYYGLLLEEGAGPAGVVTVQVFESEVP